MIRATPPFNGLRMAVLLILIGALLVPSSGARAETFTLRLLHINDVYEISPQRGRGGMAPLMTLLKEERAGAAHSITTLGGDLVSPSLMSGLTKGQHMIAAMNALGLDLAVLGNHEFDFGNELLGQRMAESRFRWLASNVLGPDGQPFSGASAIELRDLGGLKVGFLGLLTPDTGFLSSVGGEVSFTDSVAVARQAVLSLQDAQADVIVALTHLSLAEDRALLREVPEIDLILGGHDHDPMSFYEDGTLIIKAGSDAHFLAVVDLTVEVSESDKGRKVVVTPDWRYRSTAGVAPDPSMAALVAAKEEALGHELDQVLGTTATALDSRKGTVRTRESEMGNLIADAQRAATAADVAIANGGGIRGDRTYDAGSALTRRDVLSELPFGNVTVKLKLKGATLLEALEHGFSAVEDKAGRFPQVSGMAVIYDSAAAAGSRVVAVLVGGKSLDKTGDYTLATNDYIAGGGDGYAVLAGAERLIDAAGAQLMASQVMEYIAARGKIAPMIEGRVRQR